MNAATGMPVANAGQRRRRIAILALCIVLVILLLLAATVRTHLRVAGILLRVRDPNAHGALTNFDTYPEDESLTEITTPSGPIRARAYIPRGLDNAPGMVIVHGLHHLGIDEPRLIAFHGRGAGAGEVMEVSIRTPHVCSLQLGHERRPHYFWPFLPLAPHRWHWKVPILSGNGSRP